MEFNDRRLTTPLEDSFVAADVARARKSMQALSKLNGGTKATFAARTRHYGTLAEVHTALAARGRHDVVGHLVEEQKLHERMVEARRNGQDRPELQQRLKTVRSSLRKVL